MKMRSEPLKPFKNKACSGGPDETRTRDLRRDRVVLYYKNPCIIEFQSKSILSGIVFIPLFMVIAFIYTAQKPHNER